MKTKFVEDVYGKYIVFSLENVAYASTITGFSYDESHCMVRVVYTDKRTIEWTIDRKKALEVIVGIQKSLEGEE